jgi:hypothetical protein
MVLKFNANSEDLINLEQCIAALKTSTPYLSKLQMGGSDTADFGRMEFGMRKHDIYQIIERLSEILEFYQNQLTPLG